MIGDRDSGLGTRGGGRENRENAGGQRSDPPTTPNPEPRVPSPDPPVPVPIPAPPIPDPRDHLSSPVILPSSTFNCIHASFRLELHRRRARSRHVSRAVEGACMRTHRIRALDRRLGSTAAGRGSGSRWSGAGSVAAPLQHGQAEARGGQTGRRRHCSARPIPICTARWPTPASTSPGSRCSTAR